MNLKNYYILHFFEINAGKHLQTCINTVFHPFSKLHLKIKWDSSDPLFFFIWFLDQSNFFNFFSELTWYQEALEKKEIILMKAKYISLFKPR